MVSLFDAIRPLQMTVYRAYAGPGRGNYIFKRLGCL